MKTNYALLFALSLLLMVHISSAQNFTETYHTSFDNPEDANGWFFTSTAATISVANSQLIFDSPHEDFFHIFSPIGAVQGDFAYRLAIGSDAEVELGFMGIAGFKTLLGLLGTEEGIEVVYTYDLISYSEPQLTTLFSISDPPTEINSIELETRLIAGDLLVYLFINDELYQSGTVESVGPDLLYGQLVLGFGAENDDPIYLPISEVTIHYNPYSSTKSVFTDTFDNPNSPWFRFGEYDYLAEGLYIMDGKLNFHHFGDADSQFLVVSPVGAVGDFTLTIESSGTDMNGTGSFGRIFDSYHFAAVWYEDDEVYLGYNYGSPEPQVLAFATANMENVSSIQFSINQAGNDLLMSLYHNDQFVINATIPNAPSRLRNGHIAGGYEMASELNIWFEEVNLTYEKTTVGIIEYPSEKEQMLAVQNNPNPCSAFTNISIESGINGLISLLVYDAYGKLVHSESVNSTREVMTIRLNTKQLSSGIYYYQAVSSKGFTSKAKKLIVCH